MGEMPYPALQSMFDPFFPKGLQWYWRGDFVNELTDEAIDAHIAQVQKLPRALSLMHLYPIDGAVRRVGKGDTAWNTRDATWSMVIAGIDPNPQKDRSQSAKGRRNHALDQGLLVGRPPLLGWRRLCEFHDGRWRRKQTEGHLRRQLRPPRHVESQIRSDELLLREPEHQTAALLDDHVCRAVRACSRVLSKRSFVHGARERSGVIRRGVPDRSAG
jgi:hypothetical protein